MRTYALLALLAATVYADGHLTTSTTPTNSTMPHEEEHHDEEHKEGSDMNTAEMLAQAIDNVAELFMEEVDIIDDDKIQPGAFAFASDLKGILEMVCDVSHRDMDGERDVHIDDEHHEDGEHHEDEDHTRRLDGHETAMPVPAEPMMPMEENDTDETCKRAYKLLRSMEEYADEKTSAERRQEISDEWGEGLDDAWATMFEGASIIAASVAGLATAVAVLSF